MKAHLAKVSLALLSTVFLLGCQEQGSSPVGPEGPQFDKKDSGNCAEPVNGHCHGDEGGGGGRVSGTFTAALTGEVTSVEDVILNEGQTQLTTGGTPATLDLTFFRDDDIAPGWATCFNSGTAVAPASVFSGPLGINFKKNDPVDVEIQFNFDAKGTDGTVVRSGFGLHGVIEEPGNWPAVNGPSTITVTTYVMIHGNGPGSAVACTGSGNVNVTIDVTRTS